MPEPTSAYAYLLLSTGLFAAWLILYWSSVYEHLGWKRSRRTTATGRHSTSGMRTELT